jgi:hypothetical protein
MKKNLKSLSKETASHIENLFKTMENNIEISSQDSSEEENEDYKRRLARSAGNVSSSGQFHLYREIRREERNQDAIDGLSSNTNDLEVRENTKKDNLKLKALKKREKRKRLKNKKRKVEAVEGETVSNE